MPRRDNAPVGHTCPMIDEVISAIKSVNWDENNYWDESRLVEIMEKIRSANDSLRTWGNDLCYERDELENYAEDLKRQLEFKQGEHDDLLQILQQTP